MTETSRVPVLMYHRVGQVINRGERRFAISERGFATHMQSLADAGYHAVAIDAFVDWLFAKRQLPAGSFLLTFDDGYRGVYEHALPILEKLGWQFAVFLVSDYLGKKDFWVGGASRSGNNGLLSSEEIIDMQSRGCDFHSHTCSHKRLTSLNDAQLSDELNRSRDMLSRLLGTEAEFLAYPYGDVDQRVKEEARKSGYRAAFSTRSGFNHSGEDPFMIRRIDVMGTDTPSTLLRKIELGSNDGSLYQAAHYYWNQLKQRVLNTEKVPPR